MKEGKDSDEGGASDWDGKRLTCERKRALGVHSLTQSRGRACPEDMAMTQGELPMPEPREKGRGRGPLYYLVPLSKWENL